MTEEELWKVIWRALRMVEIAIAQKYGFGEFRNREPTQECEIVVISP